MTNYSHLMPEIVKLFDRSNEERIRYIKSDRWLGYARANDILKKMDDLVTHPRVERAPGMLIIGRTNNGKSHIIDRFKKKHPVSENFGGEKVIAPVLVIQSPPGPSDYAFYCEILKTLYERVPSTSADAARHRAVEVLSKIETKVLVIDELHSMLAGASKKQQIMLNAIKYLCNELKISIVGVGTVDLLRAVSVDPQIQNRLKPELLPLWSNDKEFQKLLRSYEHIIPLKESSSLHSSKMANKILAMSEGTIGEVSALINLAAIFAIQHGEEKISYEILNSCGFIAPSDRVKEAAKV